MLKIDRIDPAKVSAQEFYDNYMKKNRPCIFKESLTANWKSRKLWLTSDGNIDFIYLKKTFGDAKVPVADCHVKHYDSQLKQDMLLNEYIEYWEKQISSGYKDSKCLYLKDWHFTKAFPAYNAYEVPIYFQSDWLNEFWNERDDSDDDYRFVYMGVKGTWTPFHADVFRSFSWSANICGRKRWLFCSPKLSERLLRERRTMPYDIMSVDDIAAEDGFAELIQEPGETIFVPSLWYHQVYNLENTISINHNWFNACNIDIVWEFLTSSLKDVRSEIADCREMDGWNQQCQLLLKAVHGMDFAEFYKLLSSIARNRLKRCRAYFGDKMFFDDKDAEFEYYLLKSDLTELEKSFKKLRIELCELVDDVIISDFDVLTNDVAKAIRALRNVNRDV